MATVAANACWLSPVMVGAWAFLGEHLTPLKLLGGLLITLGAIVLAFA